MNINIIGVGRQEQCRFFALPAELRLAILEYVFHDPDKQSGLVRRSQCDRMILDDFYSTNVLLAPLLVSRQLYQDSVYLGMTTTTFLMTSLFGDVPQRLSVLQSNRIDIIRNITFVADARQFRKLVDWNRYPFGMSNLKLDTLTIVLHRSSFWHYLYDYTGPIVTLLRTLQGVRRLVMVRNDAKVKGSLHAWYNRLVGMILKVDHHQRYDATPVNLEEVWWKWSFDGKAQSLCLEAQPSRPWTGEEEYLQSVLPLMEELRESVENEEWNPDPRSRNMYY